MPQFIGIGAQRCATTWLAQCLGEHPDIYVPAKKELQYFDVHYEKGSDWYGQQFAPASNAQLSGEYTPDYLPKRYALDRLISDVPEAKLLVLLRDPVERAESAYQLFKSRGRIEEDEFLSALKRHDHLIDYGRYAEQLEYLFEHKSRSDVMIILFDDVKRQPKQILSSVFSWLGVDNAECPSAGKIANLSLPAWLQKGLDSNAFLRFLAASPIGTAAKAFRKRRHHARASKPNIDSSCADYIRQKLGTDTSNLSSLLDRDLSCWQSHPAFSQRSN